MKRLILLAAMLCVASTSYAEFNERSLYHIGASAAIAGSVDTIAYHGIIGFDAFDRVAISTAVGLIPGAFKEYVMDGEADSDDMLCNFVGAVTGAIFSEWANSQFGPSRNEIYLQAQASEDFVGMQFVAKW
jgi:hypothetical protein